MRRFIKTVAGIAIGLLFIIDTDLLPQMSHLAGVKMGGLLRNGKFSGHYKNGKTKKSGNGDKVEADINDLKKCSYVPDRYVFECELNGDVLETDPAEYPGIKNEQGKTVFDMDSSDTIHVTVGNPFEIILNDYGSSSKTWADHGLDVFDAEGTRVATLNPPKKDEKYQQGPEIIKFEKHITSGKKDPETKQNIKVQTYYFTALTPGTQYVLFKRSIPATRYDPETQTKESYDRYQTALVTVNVTEKINGQ